MLYGKSPSLFGPSRLIVQFWRRFLLSSQSRLSFKFPTVRLFLCPQFLLYPNVPAASHLRPSSRATYDSRFGSFVKWCSTRQIDPYHAPLRAVADFLIHLFDDKKALSTIASHRTAISTMHSGFPDGSSVSSSVHLSRLTRSFFLSRPPERTLVPPWSLHAVLRALAKPPFEPLAQASFHHLTVKTVFLIAVASG